MILGTVARVVHVKSTTGIGFVLPLLLLLCLCVSSWGACSTNTYNTGSRGITCGSQTEANCLNFNASETCGGASRVGDIQFNRIECRGSPRFGYCYLDITCCSTQAEADSVACVNNPTAEQCKSSDPSECTTAECCMEFNQGNVPVDSGFVGCEPPADGSDACSASGSSAVCNGVSVYSVCTQQYLWNKQTQQCAPVSTNNCVEIRRTDDMCTDVECNSYTETEVSNMHFNPSTKCYEGRYREYTHMECSNGLRGQVFASAYQDYVVCDSYLDSLVASITESTGNETQVTVTEYIQGDYPGGTSVDAEGNTVTNSPGGQTGGTSTQHQEVVTKDSAGTTVIVKASDGSDSTQMVNSFSSVRCLGCSNGYCTLSNSATSWTCEANSCSQALMSYNMNGGVCSPNYNEYYNQPQGASNDLFKPDTTTKIALTDSVIDYTEQLNRLNRNFEDFVNPIHLGDGATYGFFGALAAMQSVVQNTSAERMKHDSLLQYDLKLTMNEFRSAVDSALNVHAGQITSATSASGESVVSALSDQNSVMTSVGSAVTSAVQQGSANIVSAVHGTTSAVNSASSTLATRIQESTEAIRSLPRQTDSVISLNLDSYYDRITPVMVEQTQSIVEAIDSLKIEVKMDSFPTVDSVSLRGSMTFPQDAHIVYDTANFEQLWLQGYSHGLEAISIDTSEGINLDTSDMYDGRWIPDSTVDSLEALLPGKLDSISGKANVESDSMTRALAAKYQRVAGLDDSSTDAIRELFSGHSDACPRDCFRVNVPRVGILPAVSIHLDTVVCDIRIAGSWTFIDFIKTVLKLLTSILCVMMIWNLMVNMGGKK